jgi:alpha-D-xyloside xylohydrolase
LGECFNELNHTHQVIRNGSQDNGASKGSATYKPIPFYLSTTGYGLWVDTTAEAVFDLNASSREDVLITVPAQKLRIVLIQGPEFPRILDRFTSLAGRSMLPPYWSFAPWIGRDYHRNDADVREDMEKTRTLGLPTSVILIDSPWATGYNSYLFNPKQFRDEPGLVKDLHAAGFKPSPLAHLVDQRQDHPAARGGFRGQARSKVVELRRSRRARLFRQRQGWPPVRGHLVEGSGLTHRLHQPRCESMVASAGWPGGKGGSRWLQG